MVRAWRRRALTPAVVTAKERTVAVIHDDPLGSPADAEDAAFAAKWEAEAALLRYRRSGNGRDALRALAASARHRRLAAALDHIPDALHIEPSVLDEIHDAAAGIAEAVLALPSVSRSDDLPGVRSALGMTGKARADHSDVARLVALQFERIAAGHTPTRTAGGGQFTLIDEKQLYRYAAAVFGVSASTVARAWVTAVEARPEWAELHAAAKAAIAARKATARKAEKADKPKPAKKKVRSKPRSWRR